MPFAIIIRGPAGSGKSTVAEAVKSHFLNSVHLDIDSIKHIISDQSSKERSDIAHKVCSFFISQLTENEYDIILEEIFREEYYFEVLDILNEANYNIIKVFLTAPVETLVSRDKKRTKNKGEKVITDLKNEIQPLEEDLIIDSSDKSIDEIKSNIINKVNGVA